MQRIAPEAAAPGATARVAFVLALVWCGLPPTALAAEGKEGDGQRACDPPCRSGYFCRAGECVSECNPPCPPGLRCVDNDCQPIPPPPRRSEHSRLLALFGVWHAPFSDSAGHLGEIRLELSGKYSGFQIGPAFGDNLLQLRSAFTGRIPFQFPGLPLYLVPTIAIGYAFGWVDDGDGGQLQDIFIAPGFRMRYNVLPRLAVVLDVVQLQVNFLRLYSSSTNELTRVDAVPITWNVALGAALLY